ncbi:MAG: chorismate mutase [Candidatus Methanomethylophilus sp.]|jgi:chorismate mutase|nr:chorismate mutase [Methanomethylophilus sp.]
MDQPVSIKELRKEIEDIDEQLIDLIATRMDIADELARAKKRSGQSYWNEDVEKEIVSRYHELCKEVSLSTAEAEQIAHTFLSISKERQKEIYDAKK